MVLAPLLLLVLLIALLVPVLGRLVRSCHTSDITPEWLENFSVTSYYPMQNLLGAEDFQFLSRQPGFDLSLYKKLRRERLVIFRQYLNRAIADFNRLHMAARLILPYAPGDHSDVVIQLVQIRIRFSLAVLQAQVNYVLCCAGYRALKVQTVINQLEAMNSQRMALSAARG